MRNLKELEKIIKELTKLVEQLSKLAWEIGSLISLIIFFYHFLNK